MINLNLCEKIFLEYVSNYDKNDFMIDRKISHTLRVKDLSKDIAKSLDLSNEDVELATLIGLLHDIGRFEQAKIARTYADSKEIDHASIGVNLLFKENKIREFLPNIKEYDSIIEKAVDQHSKLKIQDGLPEKEELFTRIVRDADKLDIYNIFVNDDIVRIGKSSGYENIAEFTDEVLDAFYENRQLHKNELKTVLDWFINTIAFTFDMNYKKTFEILKKEDYLNRIIDSGIILWSNKKEEFEKIRKHMNEYVENKIV